METCGLLAARLIFRKCFTSYPEHKHYISPSTLFSSVKFLVSHPPTQCNSDLPPYTFSFVQKSCLPLFYQVLVIPDRRGLRPLHFFLRSYVWVATSLLKHKQYGTHLWLGCNDTLPIVSQNS